MPKDTNSKRYQCQKIQMFLNIPLAQDTNGTRCQWQEIAMAKYNRSTAEFNVSSADIQTTHYINLVGVYRGI